MQTSAWQHNGELTQTVPWFRSNESALRATIADLMERPGVRSVCYQEPKSQLLVRFDRSLTSADKLRATALCRTPHFLESVATDAVRWAPTASKVLLTLATALAR
jgi:hypothetical protein